MKNKVAFRVELVRQWEMNTVDQPSFAKIINTEVNASSKVLNVESGYSLSDSDRFISTLSSFEKKTL